MVDFMTTVNQKLDRNHNSWPGIADEISVSYYLASNAAAAKSSSSEACSSVEGIRTLNVAVNELKLRNRCLICPQALFTVARNSLTLKRFSVDAGDSS